MCFGVSWLKLRRRDAARGHKRRPRGLTRVRMVFIARLTNCVSFSNPGVHVNMRRGVKKLEFSAHGEAHLSLYWLRRVQKAAVRHLRVKKA